MYILDVDKCAEKTHRCSRKANCTNTPGSYNCQCHDGYHLKEDGKNCSGIDAIFINKCWHQFTQMKATNQTNHEAFLAHNFIHIIYILLLRQI